MKARIINERTDQFASVSLLYHGLESAEGKKLSLYVQMNPELDVPAHVLWTYVPEEKAMDAFNHPFFYLASELDGNVMSNVLPEFEGKFSKTAPLVWEGDFA